MRKFTIIVAIAFFCSFAVVRRKQDEDQADAVFRETVTQMLGDETAIFHSMNEEASIGNGDHPLQDQPVEAASLLNGAFNEIILVNDGKEWTWVKRSEFKIGWKKYRFSLN